MNQGEVVKTLFMLGRKTKKWPVMIKNRGQKQLGIGLIAAEKDKETIVIYTEG